MNKPIEQGLWQRLKAREAVIAWTPSRSPRATAGQVMVGRVGDSFDGLLCTVGAPDLSVTKLQVFLEFHALVVRDGIDPVVAHKAFLAIDEYAESIAGDICGSR